MQTTLKQVLEFITQATLSDLDRIEAAIQPCRSQALQIWRTNLRAGETVMLVEIKPVVFQGLTGTVVGKAPRSKDRFTVRLDKRSTQTLRLLGGDRVKVRAGVEEHETAVPVGCLAPFQP
ncbi:hypothetical protein GCM10029978_067330 [Actinoallomurus acanthiterrae]